MTSPSIAPSRLALAYALDWLAGDPEWFPHPVRAMGRAITAGERCLRNAGDGEANETVKGALLAGTIVTGSWAFARVALRNSDKLPRPWAALVEAALAWTTLATRNLLDEAKTVLDDLDAGDLDRARRRLARIVGRDTQSLAEEEIARAIIETVAESACDGIVAPLVWLSTGGVPAAFAYKAANTLDSMIGHPEPPYRNFGHAAARLDDVANLVPARLTALCIVAAAFLAGCDAQLGWRVWLRDGGKHASPNAGQSEAAMAGALGVRLGGCNSYGGKLSSRPLLGAEGRPARPADARKSIRIVATASVLAFGAALVCSWWRSGKTRSAPL
ncbi:adenosylcobinamide-phosphate synthase CbiB [uncultured Paludibaculum sp.]|uniref:adenosylcobinamide-phosphate synthase CbiB n=1 Tax=uncultured Paludibaculum sp. TaxID=1765020 RepID=UPI002AABC5EF|nr:adenosylcobinamide-phosphate synthase CbiB [uncultured Paludibaculum sp.]